MPARMSTCPLDPSAFSGQLAGNSALRAPLGSPGPMGSGGGTGGWTRR